MAFCTECGTYVPDEVKFCTSCGKPMGMAPQTQAVTAGVSAVDMQTPPAAAVIDPPRVTPPPQAVPSYAAQPGTPPPAAFVGGETAPGTGSKYQPISTGGYIGIMLLMCIPIIGQILTIVWACGGCRKVNKRNLARAMLVFLIICIVVSVILYFVGIWVLEAAAPYIGEAGEANDLGDIFKLINALDQ